MADYIALRKGRNTLSTLLHAGLNIALAIFSTALTVISGNWIFGVLLVLLSKWRIVAVRPRYWWVNLKANLVDLIVGISLTLLVYIAGTELNIWHVILTIVYILWLGGVKPRSETIFTEIQAMFAIFFGTFATTLVCSQFDPIVGAAVCFIIGYGASRHILVQSSDDDYTFITFISGILMAELSWIFYHWSIVYELGDATVMIPQLPIAVSILFFLFARGYKSAVLHDGKIRADDIIVPAIFSASVLFVMVFFFSVASFNV